MAIIIPDDPFWRKVARLREYEGRRCYWRLPVAGLVYASAPSLLVAITVLAAYANAHGFRLEIALTSAVVLLTFTGIALPRWTARRFHRDVIARRLQTYEAPNPESATHVLVRGADLNAARAALSRHKFNPGIHATKTGSPPPDAPDLDYKLIVQEPAAWAQSATSEDRAFRIAATLRGAGIRARVGDFDVPAAGRADRAAA